MQNKKNGQMNIYSNMESSILLLATVIEKVLVKSAILLILFPFLSSANESKIDVYISMSTILCFSVSQTTFHMSVTSVADAS